jgi:hypothetical protein
MKEERKEIAGKREKRRNTKKKLDLNIIEGRRRRRNNEEMRKINSARKIQNCM